MKTKQISIDKCRKVIQDFCIRHKVIFEDKGECGFGRECVGIMGRNSNWVDYNPCRHPDYEQIHEFFDDRFYETAPPDAYHKHSCLAVLGRGDEAVRQLYDWVVRLNELGVTIEEFQTGATGIQAMITGIIGYAVKMPKP